MPIIQDWIKPGMLFFSCNDYWVFRVARVLQDANDGTIFLNDGLKTYSVANCDRFGMRHFAVPRDFISDGQVFKVWWDRKERCLYVTSDSPTSEAAIIEAIEAIKPNAAIDVRAWEGDKGGAS